MGEALLRRSGGQGEAILPVIPGVCTLLVSVKDSLNRPAVGVQVNCKDGGSWYNYTTNDKGQCMFSTNSGSANITVFNRYKNNIWILDQQKKTIDIDAPISTSNKINIQFEGYNIGHELNFIMSTGSEPTDSALPTGNYAFMVSKKINVFIGGGGSGGSGSGRTSTGVRGGCAGGANLKTLNIDKNNIYYAYIGIGGTGGSGDYWSDTPASSGGTSVFGNISAYGGSSSSYGSGMYKTGNTGESSQISNFGGGGQNGYEVVDGNSKYSGSVGWPGGGWGGYRTVRDGGIKGYTNGGSGKDGLGGGGGGSGGYGGYASSIHTGGKGGNGCIRIKFLE